MDMCYMITFIYTFWVKVYQQLTLLLINDMATKSVENGCSKDVKGTIWFFLYVYRIHPYLDSTK